MSTARTLPPWALGLANAPMGFYYGFLSTAMPILLSRAGVGEAQIATVATIAFSPTFWAWLLCPVLDVGLPRKLYAVGFYAAAALCLAAGVVLLGHAGAGHVGRLTAVLTAGCAAAAIGGNAVGGWIPDLVGDEHYDVVGAWFNVANLGAAGAFGTLAVVLVRALPLGLAAAMLGVVLLAPAALVFFFPATGQPVRGAREVFATFFRDLGRVLRRPSSLYGFVCFLLPASSFAMTNLFAGLSADFHTSERWVTAIGGLGVAVACSAGCLLGVPLCRLLSRRTVYLGVGLCGAAAAAGMIWAPRTPAGFAVGVLAYNFFQGVNFTSMSALLFEMVGSGNGLAGTQIALMTALVNVPITAMTYADGRGYARGGVAGMLAVDAGVSVLVGVPLLLFFRWAGRPSGKGDGTLVAASVPGMGPTGGKGTTR